jgi:hypothetical protein
MRSGASVMQNIDAIFFMLRWARFGFDKNRTGTRYVELVCFASSGTYGSVVRFGTLGVQNVDASFSCLGRPGSDPTNSAPGDVTPNLYFYSWWDLRVTLCVLVHLGRETSMHYFACSGGPRADPTESVLRHITLNLSFCIHWDLHVT